MVFPGPKNDNRYRHAVVLNAAYRKKQKENFPNLDSCNPLRTTIVILPIDMASMDIGKIKEYRNEQHEDLTILAKSQLPFAHIDPRKSNPLKRLTSLVERNNCKGVKIFPTLGYKPDNKILMEDIYPYMVKKNFPLLAHCFPGPSDSKDLSKKKASAMAHPNNFIKVMETFPELRICLGHFGGIDEWRKHLHATLNYENRTWRAKIIDWIKGEKYPNLYTDMAYTLLNFQKISPSRKIDNSTWLAKIIELIKSKKYPNLYTDMTHSLFTFQDIAPSLKFLLKDKNIVCKLLFSSDFCMVEKKNTLKSACLWIFNMFFGK